jgi:hypothetical protein
MAAYHRLCAVACLAATAAASEHHGQVLFNGLPVPGAMIIATRDGNRFSTSTDQQGFYSFPDLSDGTWTLAIGMSGFAPIVQGILVAPNAPAIRWDLKLLPLDQIRAEVQHPETTQAAPTKAAPGSEVAGAKPPERDDPAQLAADGFLINGSVNNGAGSPFAQVPAFGNNRSGARRLYTGGIGLILDNSALDARPFSLTGQNTPKAAYNRMTGAVTFGGPLQIPRLFKSGPNFFAAYQWTRNSNATAESALMPDAAARSGIFAGPILDPLTRLPFPGNIIPPNRVSPQAQALLKFYPLPSFSKSKAGYNFQASIVSPTHQDSLQSRWNKTLDSKNQAYGGFAFASTRADNPNLFAFLDTTKTLGIHTNVNWTRRFGRQGFLNVGYQFSRFSTRVKPYFENRENVSGEAGILGNNQDPINWGPPGLKFSSGIAGLSDSQSSFDRNQTSGLSYAMLWGRGTHSLAFGADLRRQQFNDLSQQDARGAFTFTGAQTGSDFADFLLGIPAASSIAFGNADKYFRESVYDAYIKDDWKIRPGLTLNAGLRWEYGAPITELHGRLVNLDASRGLTAAAPVVARDPAGVLTGRRYPESLIRPDKRGLGPRVGIAWRPVAGSSWIVRAGYGIYRDTSVYQTIAIQMAQQPPLSKTLSVQNSAANPLALADGFSASPITRNTFAVDPDYRIGYAQNWQLSIQRDLPWALQVTATYLGIKGTRGMQAILPNTYPAGAAIPCPACPTGFAYLTSNGNSMRESAQIQLRRRLRSGFTAAVQYTFSKSIDNDAVLGGQGGASGARSSGAPDSSDPPATTAPGMGAAARPNLAIAQNWLDLRGERGLSTFDQRHILNVQLQYTTGMGLGGGALLSGRKGALFKEWIAGVQITAASGLPQTPIYLAPVQGTGVTGTIRPEYTGAPLYAAPAGFFLNPAAYTPPPPGQWGNAGRNSITGPARFTLNASLGRTFQIGDRWHLDLRMDAANALNHVCFTAWNTAVNSAQFGLPATANAMRSVQTALRLRF